MVMVLRCQTLFPREAKGSDRGTDPVDVIPVGTPQSGHHIYSAFRENLQ
jgi:hypothetical protein